MGHKRGAAVRALRGSGDQRPITGDTLHHYRLGRRYNCTPELVRRQRFPFRANSESAHFRSIAAKMGWLRIVRNGDLALVAAVDALQTLSGSHCVLS